MTTKYSTKSDTPLSPSAKIAQLETKILELNEEILTLRSDLFAQRDEIHSLRNSRVLGRIIKARDRIGSPYTLVGRSFNKTRRTVAKYVPDAIRLPMMKNLRKSRDVIKVRLQKSLDETVSVIEVNNVEWGNRPLISVVIPYYNLGDTIDDTLDSLLSQTFKNFEVIIVDDGSTDKESVKKIKSIEASGYNANFVYQKNQGVAATRNNGIKQAKGKYIVCLDSDDMLEPTYLEKAATVLETNPDISIVTTYMTIFGVMTDEFRHTHFDPLRLYRDNMIITAAMFRKEAWEAVGGYKSKIGYEDWEYWINLTEHGYWAKQIREPLFRYRTSLQSRYVEDKDIHWSNLKLIHSLHPGYKKNIKNIEKQRRVLKRVIAPTTALINVRDSHTAISPAKANILITIPWMTFGGAETLIYNFCREIKSDYNITFITALPSENEWEYKFREITESIYHLPNLFASEDLYFDYIAHQIVEKKIDTLHIIHNGFTFEMLEKLKASFPELRVIVTLFNDRAAYFDQSLKVEEYIDIFTSDNATVVDRYNRELKQKHDVRVIPNGINCVDEFNPAMHDRREIRDELGLKDTDIAVFYVGRLSEEKNPNIFLDAAELIIKDSNASKNIRFIMIGDGGMKNAIQHQISEIDSDRIQYIGYQSAIAHFLSGADIFVLPSAIEGFPLSILEAMAMKVVVIASRVGAVPEVIDSGIDGFVVTPGSAKEIKAAIAKISDNEKLLEKMKSASRAKVETRYSNPVLGENYRKLYGTK